MKEENRRGRPRAFDAAKTIRRAREVFWDKGFTGASLDNLSAATELNRPSLYGAFGDKEELYVDTLEGYRADSLTALDKALDAGLPIRTNIANIYDTALAIYLHGDLGPRGCFLIGTATVESVQHPRVQEILRRSLNEFDAKIESRLELAVEKGELPAGSSAKTLAKLASAVMHSLAVRSRAGDSEESLRALAAAGVDWICGPEG
jgi:AcrR family transcriptional regulator